MSSDVKFELTSYEFNEDLFNRISENYFAREHWPVVYLLSNDKVCQAYVGETVDVMSRMQAHLKHSNKSKLTSVNFVSSRKFNKSATLDLESNLIKYLSADGRYQLQNANLGLVDHSFYQRESIYRDIFHQLWNELRKNGIAEKSIDEIDNSDLFKYSPYKSLGINQRRGLLTILRNLTDPNIRNIVIEGGAGTGKSILAVYLFKILHTPTEEFNYTDFGEDEIEFIDLVNKVKEAFEDLKMGLVVPMSSFRKTLKRVFSGVAGLNSSMVIGPTEVSKNEYDILLVDEAHRLRRRVNLTNYKSFDDGCKRLGLDELKADELDWVQLQSEKLLLFYDSGQSIKPTDVLQHRFSDLIKSNNSLKFTLTNQFRVKGGTDYSHFVKQLLYNKLDKKEVFKNDNYELFLFDSLEELKEVIKDRDEEYGLSRMIAGYSWKWISKNNPKLYDIEEDGIKLRWNSTSDDWINTEGSVNEVGCIHTTQGYDLNYAAVIFGHEIIYNEQTDSIEIIPQNYHDINGKRSIENEEDLHTYILNIYKTILLRGIKGTYVYACDSGLRKYLSKYIQPFHQQRESKLRILNSDEVRPFVNAIPFYDLRIAAGLFSEKQLVSEVDWLEMSDTEKVSEDYFACRIVGESMNKVIPNGTICLFKKYYGGSREGKIVLVQNLNRQDADYGSYYTIKEYHSKKHIVENSWRHESIVLKPLSYDDSYQEIVLKEDEIENFQVLGEFVKVLD